MNNIKITPTTFILISVATLIFSILITLTIYKLLKYSCSLCHFQNIKLFTVGNAIIYALPFAVCSISFYHATANKAFVPLLIISILLLLILIFINIHKHGFKLGIMLSLFRIIGGFLGLAYAYAFVAMIALAIICGGIFISSWIEHSKLTVTTLDGEVFSLIKTGSNTYVDVSGKLFTKTTSGNFIDDQGNYYYLV